MITCKLSGIDYRKCSGCETKHEIPVAIELEIQALTGGVSAKVSRLPPGWTTAWYMNPRTSHLSSPMDFCQKCSEILKHETLTKTIYDQNQITHEQLEKLRIAK